MLRNSLTAFLKIRPDETRMVALMAALFLCVQAGQGIGENAAFALFLSKINVNVLPYMYMGLGGVVFLASIFYSASLSRFKNSSVVRNLLAGSAVLFVLEWIGIAVFGNSLSYPLLWLTTYGMSIIVGTLLWTVAGEVCDARQAKRLFPLFTSMGILGSVLGNMITGVIAERIGTNSLIFLYSISLGAGFLLSHKIAGRYFKPQQITNLKFSLLKDVRNGYEFMRETQLFRLIAISSILYSILFFTVDFPFSERISNEFLNNPAGLAGFKGLFSGITTAVTFFVSLFLANRLFTRLGVVNSVLIMPLTYVVAFALFFVSFNFWGAVGAKFGQLVILGGVASTAWNALFNVVPPERRGQVLAFNNGIPSQIGVVLSGVLIILSRQVLSVQNILLIGALVALATTYITIKMRPAYGDALLGALRAGRVELFGEEDESFSGYKDDHAALQIALKALHDVHANTRRLAAEMLARMGSILAAPDLLERMSDEDAGVRAAAVNALADLDARQVVGMIARGLDDPDTFVRETTLASLLKLGVASSPELDQTLKRLLKDQNLKISTHAAVVLLSFGKNEAANTLLLRLLNDDDIEKRHVALDALGLIVESTNGALPFEIDLVVSALDDPSPIIRRDAVRVVSMMKDWSAREHVFPCLADEDSAVRRIASETLRQAWPESRSGVLKILETMQNESLDAALDSIPSADLDVLHVLRGYIEREVSNIRYLRTLIQSLSTRGHVVALLVGTLQHRDSLSEERLIKAVGLFGNSRALDLVRKSLNAGDAVTRAAALETLETLGDPTITKEVLPILDRGGVFQMDKDHKLTLTDVIGDLLISDDYWLRAISARAVQELKLDEHIPVLRGMQSDPSELVRQTATNVLAEMEGTMKTLKTISTLDRVLLLREIPMFGRLAPEDLEKIAEVVQEQLFPRQAVICREGEPGDSLFIIVHGKVNVIRSTGNQETIVAVRDDGQFVGEMAILESSMRSATLRAATDVRMLVLSGEAFKSILRDRPEVAISVLQHISSRVRELTEKVGAAG